MQLEIYLHLFDLTNGILPDVQQETVKIHAFIAKTGLASRRKAEELVAAGKILVNGIPALVGQRIHVNQDKVEFQGEQLQLQHDHVYLAVNKPLGYLSTTEDPTNRKTVLSLLSPSDQVPGLHIVGRLDQNSEGLLLLTTDGELTYKLTHPKFQVPKTYRVLLQGVPSTPALHHLRRGIKLKESYVVPSAVNILGHEEQKNTWLEITVCEGQKHLVRKMCSRMGYEVLRLIRTKIGNIELIDLPVGKYRQLTQEELARISPNNTSFTGN